jgi:hypothetical protein
MEKAELDRIKERLYFVRWTFNNYMTNNPPEPRLETFQWDERQQALARYMKLSEEYYAEDVKFQVAQPQDVNVENFLNSF